VPYTGFTWNLPPSSAELLLLILMEAEQTARYSVDREVITWFSDSLLLFLEAAPDGAAPASDGTGSTKAARLDGYRDRRRRVR